MWPWKGELLVECLVTGVTETVDLKVTLAHGGTPCVLPPTAFAGDIYSLSRDGACTITVTPPTGALPEAPTDLSVTVEPVAASTTAGETLYRIYDLDTGACENVTAGSILNGSRGAWHWADPSNGVRLAAGEANPAALTNLVWTGFNSDDTYKTTKLVMRYVPAKNATVNILNRTDGTGTIAHSFWMAVYETTQAQWTKIYGTTPAFSSVGATKPASDIAYDNVRGAKGGAGEEAKYYWPNDPDSNSFLGKLRTLTQVNFDLPWQAVWEYASQANSGWASCNDKTLMRTYNTNVPFGTENGRLDAPSGIDPNFPGTYTGNSSAYAAVGSYAPSVLGFYDMHGNVGEMCVDWANGYVLQSNQCSLQGAANVDPTDYTKMLAWDKTTYPDKSEGTKRYRAGSTYGTALSGQTPNYTRTTQVVPDTGSSATGFRVVIIEND